MHWSNCLAFPFYKQIFFIHSWYAKLRTQAAPRKTLVVKDDSGAYAVFTELGSSASQMTAAKIIDVFARLPDCEGQAADAVSAYTQVKMEDAPRLLKILKSECPDV